MKIRKLICVILSVLMVFALASCGSQKDTDTHTDYRNGSAYTPADSPVHIDRGADKRNYFIYDTAKGVWQTWAKTPNGTLVQQNAYVRVDPQYPSSWEQPIAYEEPSMDRPMFISFWDGNNNQTDSAQKVLTGHDVFTSGSLGTPESTGVVDLSYVCPTEPEYGTLTWTLKDGVLIVHGGSNFAFNNCCVKGNSPFSGNQYIRTIIWDSAAFSDWYFFDGCSNLETIIVTNGDGGVVNQGPNYTNFATAEGKTQKLLVTEPLGKNVNTPLIIQMYGTLNSDATIGHSGLVSAIDGRDDTFVSGTYTSTNTTDSGATTRYGSIAQWPGVIPQYIQNAYLTQAAADAINAASAKWGYGFTVTANTSGGTNPVDPTPTPEPTPEPTPTPTPAPQPSNGSYDPEQTAGGTAANPVCSNWAREDVIAAWSLFSDRIPYLKDNGPRDNIIEKDLRQPITRAEFATLAVAAYDYILGDTAPNDGYGHNLDEWDLATGGKAQELAEPKQSDISSCMTDLWINNSVPHYYLDGIQACICMGLMNGYSNTAFGSDDHLTREQAATVLGRIADRYSDWQYRANPSQSAEFPAWTGANPYTDTISNWALDWVLRARAAGIMIGTSDTTFSAKADFTREQALVTLLRMVNYCKPWYRELSTSELASKAVHLAANPESTFSNWYDAK